MAVNWDELKQWVGLQRVRPTDDGYTLVVQRRNGDWVAVHGDVTVLELAELTGWEPGDIPGHELPKPPVRPGNALPVPPVRPGQGLPAVPVRPGNELPAVPVRPDNSLPPVTCMPPNFLVGIDLPIVYPPGETKPVEPPKTKPIEEVPESKPASKRWT